MYFRAHKQSERAEPYCTLSEVNTLYLKYIKRDIGI